MISIMFYVIPALFALLGMQKKFAFSLLGLFYVTWGVYLGLAVRRLVRPVFGFVPNDMQHSTEMFAALAVAVLFVAVLGSLTPLCNKKLNQVVMPDGLNEIGGLALGALAGMVLVNFLLMCFCASPIRKWAEKDTYFEIWKTSTENTRLAMDYVNTVSFQDEDTCRMWEMDFDGMFKNCWGTKYVQIDNNGNLVEKKTEDGN